MYKKLIILYAVVFAAPGRPLDQAIMRVRQEQLNTETRSREGRERYDALQQVDSYLRQEKTRQLLEKYNRND